MNAIYEIGQTHLQTTVDNEKMVDKKWTELTEEQWTYWLEVLPPEKWKRVDGVEIFRVCEYLTSNITQHCTHYKGRYFSANRRTSEKYEDIANQIKSI